VFLTWKGAEAVRTARAVREAEVVDFVDQEASAADLNRLCEIGEMIFLNSTVLYVRALT